jgi:hypothetical protein
MDFGDTLKQFSAKVDALKGALHNEDMTKTSLILPFFSQILGYDIFNPYEFCPEYIADVGTKKGERVDYAILFNGKPTIIVEAKWCGVDDLHLDKHGNQLFRYFATNVETRFGILTNGIVYKFYTDLGDKNVMDLKPFLEIDLLNVREQLVPELMRFRKSKFDADELFDRAEELRYSSEIRAYFMELLNTPSDDFIRFMGRACYDGKITQVVLEKLRPIVSSTLNGLVEEMVKERIERALASTKEKQPPQEEAPKETEPEPEPTGKVITTEREIQSYLIIKAILAGEFDISKITYKDTQNYFAVLYNGMVTKWICRFRPKGDKLIICLPGESGQEVRNELNTHDDIFKYRNDVIASARRFEQLNTNT